MKRATSYAVGMSIAEGLLPEFDHEMANTRRALERVPEEQLGWRPHPKSPTLGWLATHLASMPQWAAMTMQVDAFDIGGEAPPAEVGSREELLAMFDKNVAAARASIVEASDEKMLATWTLLMNGNPIFALPRMGVLRGMILNHGIHHRGQLTVYLRLNDVPVPALYGPSADESGMKTE